MADAVFIGVVFFLLASWFWFLKRAFHSYNRLFLTVLLWLGFLFILAQSGLLMQFNVMPPRIFIVIAPVIALILFVFRSQSIQPLLDAIPQRVLVGLQSFRLVMEWVLASLAAQQLIPEIMTWHGRNWDVLIALTAPFVAYYCCVRQSWPRRVLILWNVMGLILLANVFMHGLLSAPTPFQLIMVEPENTFIAQFPYVWLPGFVLPSAVLLHILSLRKYFRNS